MLLQVRDGVVCLGHFLVDRLELVDELGHLLCVVRFSGAQSAYGSFLCFVGIHGHGEVRTRLCGFCLGSYGIAAIPSRSRDKAGDNQR